MNGIGPSSGAVSGAGAPRATAPGRAARTLRRWRRAAAGQRRWMAAGLAAAAVGTSVQALQTPTAPTELVVVAAHDLPAGRRLTTADLATLHWPRGTRPAGTVTDPRGYRLASPLRRGEPVTDARLAGRGLLAGQPGGTVAVSLRLSDPAAMAMLHPGDRVDVLTGPPDPITGGGTDPGARQVAAGVLLLAVGVEGSDAPAEPGLFGQGSSGQGSSGQGSSGQGSSGLGSSGQWAAGTTAAGGTGDGGALLVMAVDRETAARLVSAAATGTISVALTADS